jgi:hypothetical protein
VTEPGILGPAPSEADLAAVAAQLGRVPRGVASVAHRCPCGNPDVLATEPRLPDGTPFPTLYYLTCPKASGAIGTIEASGRMTELSAEIAADPELRAAHAAAHADYLERRGRLGEVPEVAGISAGGMPDRVKCLHVLVGHALAAGPGVNVIGDRVLSELGPWWQNGPCVEGAKSD